MLPTLGVNTLNVLSNNTIFNNYGVLRMLTLTDNYEDTIANTKWALVKFGAPWCQTCKAITPTLEVMDSKFSDIDVYDINLQNENTVDYANVLGVKSLPTLMFFNYGKLVWRTGALPEEELHRKISEGMYYVG